MQHDFLFNKNITENGERKTKNNRIFEKKNNVSPLFFNFTPISIYVIVRKRNIIYNIGKSK